MTMHPPHIYGPEDVEAAEKRVKNSAAVQLIRSGLSREFVAKQLGMTKHDVQVLVVNVPEQVLDEHLAEGVRTLADMALTEATKIMEFGPPAQKLPLIRVMLSGMSKHIAQSTGGDQQEIKMAWDKLMEEMTDVQAQELLVTDDAIDYIDTTEHFGLSDDPDSDSDNDLSRE